MRKPDQNYFAKKNIFQKLLFAALSVAAVLVPYLFTDVYFMEPDDYLINYIANGSYGFEGSDHIARYMKMPFGYALRGLYSITTSVNWYAYLLMVLIVVSFYCFYSSIWKNTHRKFLIALTCAIECVVLPCFFTYTAVSFFMACAGMLLLYEVLKEQRVSEAVCAALLIWGSWCVRTDACLPSVAICAPLILSELWHSVRGIHENSTPVCEEISENDVHEESRSEGSRSEGSRSEASRSAENRSEESRLKESRSEVGKSEVGKSEESKLKENRSEVNAPEESVPEEHAAAGKTGTAETAKKRRAAKKRIVSPAILVFAVLEAVLFGVTAVNERAAYSAPVWKEQQEFDVARSFVTDYPMADYNLHEQELADEGFSRIDYVMLYSWQFTDRDVFTADKMKAAGKLAQDNLTTENRLTYAGKRLKRGYANIWILAGPLLFYLVLLVLLKNYRWKCGLSVLVMNYIMMAALLFIRMRFVKRVTVPIAIVTVILLFVCAGEQNKIRSRVLTAICFLLILFAGAKFVRKVDSEFSYKKRSPEDARYQEIKAEIASHPDTLYVVHGGMLSVMYYYDQPVRTVLTTDAFQNIVRSGSWDVFTPRYYNQVGRFVDNPDRLLTSIAEDPDVRYIDIESSQISAYLAEQIGYDGEPEVRTFSDTEYKIFNFTADG